MTPEDYLEIDRADPWKNEYVDGIIRPMPHPNFAHVQIVGQVGAILHKQLQRTPFWAAMGRMRLHVPSANYYTFPDVIVLREPARFEGEEEDTCVLDPVAILEVVSPDTEEEDRGARFARYQQIPSLTDYLLVFQNTPRVEYFVRQGVDDWERMVYPGLRSVLIIAPIFCKLRLADIYNRVEFPVESAAHE